MRWINEARARAPWSLPKRSRSRELPSPAPHIVCALRASGIRP